MSTSKVPMLPNEVLRQIIDDTMTDAYNDNIALLDSYVDHHVPKAEACLIDTYSTTMPDRQSRKNFATYFGDTEGMRAQYYWHANQTAAPTTRTVHFRPRGLNLPGFQYLPLTYDTDVMNLAYAMPGCAKLMLNIAKKHLELIEQITTPSDKSLWDNVFTRGLTVPECMEALEYEAHIRTGELLKALIVPTVQDLEIHLREQQIRVIGRCDCPQCIEIADRYV